MRDFQVLGKGLQRLDFGTRLVYGIFLVFCLVGYIVMLILAANRAGWSATDIQLYFSGDLANDVYPKTTAELLETAHFHLFSIPVFLLIHSHIYMMCKHTLVRRMSVVLASWMSAAIYIAGPWLVRDVSAQFSFLLAFSRGILLISLFIMTIDPLINLLKRRD